jgi:N-acyl-L-homoserine lactone synthetase
MQIVHGLFYILLSWLTRDRASSLLEAYLPTERRTAVKASMDAALAALHEEFLVEIAGSPVVLREAYQLRHQVYCVERGYETPSGDIETDRYDCHAHHVVVRHRASGQAVGTVRLVLPSPDASGDDALPMQRVCHPQAIHGFPLRGMAEISRFVLSRTQRGASPASQSLLRLSLMRGIALLTRIHGPTHLCALVEPSLGRLLRATGIHFHPAGSPVEFHGIRQLVFCQIDELLGRMRQEQPAVWGFITDDGRLANHHEHMGVTSQT